MMKCEVLDEEMKVDAVIGLTHEELRAQSHNPMKILQYQADGSAGLYNGYRVCDAE